MVGTLVRPIAVVGALWLVISIVINAITTIPVSAVISAAIPNEAVKSATPQLRECFVVVADDEVDDRVKTEGVVRIALTGLGCQAVHVWTPIGKETVIEAAVHQGRNGGEVDLVILDWDYYGESLFDKTWWYSTVEINPHDEYPDEYLVSGPVLAEILRLRGYRGPVIIITQGGTDRGVTQLYNVKRVLAKDDFWTDPALVLKAFFGQ